MKSFLESMDPQQALVLTWSITVLICALCLALAVHRCGLRPLVRFSLLGMLLFAGLGGAIALNPRKPARANVEGKAAGVTSKDDLLGIQQIMETIGPEWVGGLKFHEDGEIEPLFTSVPVERSGSSKLYAVQFSDGVVKAGHIRKVVVFSGTTFQIPVGNETQSVEVIASGDGDVLVATEDQVYFVNPQGDQSRSPVQVELIVLAQI